MTEVQQVFACGTYSVKVCATLLLTTDWMSELNWSSQCHRGFFSHFFLFFLTGNQKEPEHVPASAAGC